MYSISEVRRSFLLIFSDFEVLMSTIDSQSLSFKLLLKLELEQIWWFSENWQLRVAATPPGETALKPQKWRDLVELICFKKCAGARPLVPPLQI